jgi:hypothetical protein
VNPQPIDRTRIESFIKELSEAELRYRIRLIVEPLKFITQEKSTRAFSRFNLDESGHFFDHEGHAKTGRIM